MVNLPGPYFFGSVALLAILAVLLTKWTWIPRIHGISRWWVSTYLSLLALSCIAFALSFIGHLAFGSLSFGALTEDPDGAVAYFTETGMEAMFLAIVLVPLTIIYREARHFQKPQIPTVPLEANAKRTRLLYGIALLVGPLFFFSGIISNVKAMFFFSVVPWAFCIPSLMVAWVVNWCIENPTARLHGHLGIQRLAAVSTVHGALWIPYFYDDFGSRARKLVDIVLASSQSVLLALFVSLATWLTINLAGWVIEGFSRKQ